MPLRNDSDNPDIWASSEGGIVRFPAFIRLPASARPDNRRLLLPNDNDSVKNITLSARLPPHYVAYSRLTSFRQQIAARWSISEERIRALTVNLDGKRVLIEDNDDWEDWVATYFFHLTPPPSSSSSYGSSYGSSISRQQEDSRAKEFRIKPVHINILVESPPAYAEAGAESRSTQTNDQVASPMVDDLIAHMRSLTDDVQTYLEAQRASNPAASTTQRPDQPRTQTHQPQREAPAPQAQPVVSEETWHPRPIQPTLPNASDVVGSVLQAIQPQLRDAMPLLSGLLSSLPAQLANPARSTTLSQQTFTATPAQRPAPSAATTATPGADTVTTASNGTNDAVPQQRQSLIEELFGEISRVRTQRSASEQPRAQGANTTSEEVEGEMSTELSQAFAEMLVRQRSAPAPATATFAAAAVPEGEGHVDEVAEAEELDEEEEEAEESITVVSTPSTSSRRSSRSRSRSPRRAANRSIFATTTLFLTLFTFILSLITPTFASPSPLTTSLNPRSLTNPLNPIPLIPRANSRNLHLCKCTCFQINSTLVPLYSPSNPAKPCATCTRQFCLDQGLEICKGAKLEHTDHDTGTGLEGDVWAKCFERDSRKDQNIITLYLLVVVGLVAFAAFRGRVEGWVRRYEELGPRGLYSAVRDAPWRRGR